MSDFQSALDSDSPFTLHHWWRQGLLIALLLHAELLFILHQHPLKLSALSTHSAPSNSSNTSAPTTSPFPSPKPLQIQKMDWKPSSHSEKAATASSSATAATPSPSFAPQASTSALHEPSVSFEQLIQKQSSTEPSNTAALAQTSAPENLDLPLTDLSEAIAAPQPTQDLAELKDALKSATETAAKTAKATVSTATPTNSLASSTSPLPQQDSLDPSMTPSDTLSNSAQDANDSLHALSSEASDSSTGSSGPQFSNLDDLLAQTGPLSENTAPILMPTDLLFDYNSDQLRPGAMASLQKLGTLIKKNPQLTFTIEGHTDSFGTAEYNLNLSQRRAESVKQGLVHSIGVDPNRLKTQGYGAQHLIAPASGDIAAQQINRRVEIVVNPNGI